MNILFVCSLGRHRSKTAAHCLKTYENKLDYAGIDLEAADVPLTDEQVEKSDLIIFMEQEHKQKFDKLYPSSNKKIKILDIPDEFEYMNDMLVHKLRIKTNYPEIS